jgi:signal transduction histidine kinase
VDSEAAGAALQSSSARLRADAITWLRLNPSQISTSVLVRALQRESVPQLRELLNALLRERQSRDRRPSETLASYPHATTDFGSIVRHELTPAIGWVRRAGNREIPDYENSGTEKAVVRLTRRIDGLVLLMKLQGPLDAREFLLSELLHANSQDPPVPVRYTSESPSLTIWTDENLISILLSNAFENAFDAAGEIGGTPSKEASEIDVSWGESTSGFWVRISNPFRGTQLRLSDVVKSGDSSKTGHQGQGIGVIQMAAERLGLSVGLDGRNGLATFTLSGPRNA